MYPVKKQTTRHIWKSRFSWESISVCSGPELVISLCNVGQINPDKIVDSFYVQTCLWIVGQHYKGNFIVQCGLRQIKTTLYSLLPCEKSCYCWIKMFLCTICMPFGQHCRSNILYNVVLDVFKQHWLDICNVVPAWSIQHCISYFPH